MWENLESNLPVCNSKWVIFFKSTVTCYTYIFDQPGGIYDASMQGCCWKIDAIFMLDRSVRDNSLPLTLIMILSALIL